jgi:hypothetical protein
MITSQKGITSLYQLRCTQKSRHEYARKRQFIRTTSLKSLKRLQAPTTTSDLYLRRLLSSATIFFPPFCNRCSSNSSSNVLQQTHETFPAWKTTIAIPGRTRIKEARKCAIKQTFLLTYFLTYLLTSWRKEAKSPSISPHNTNPSRQAGGQEGRKRGSKSDKYCRSQVQTWRRNTGQKLKPIVPGPRRKCNI